MRRLLTGYSTKYNLRHHRHGHLFQNRYKSIVVEEDVYFRELLRYIHLNPMRAGAVASLSELDHYPWSGHAVVVGALKNDWQDQDYALKWFGRKEAQARASYQAYLQEGVGQGRRPELVGGGLIRSAGGWSSVKSLRAKGIHEKGDERILGSSDFVLGMVNEAEKRLKYQFPLAERMEMAEKTLAAECKTAGVREGALRAGGRRRNMSRLRWNLARKFVDELGLSLAESGRLLGVSTSAIAHSLSRIKKL
jgi:hypothetical protein